MKRTHKIVTGLALTLALGIAAAAYAHPGGGFGPCAGDGPGMGYGPGMGHGPRSGPSGVRDPAAFAERRLGEMKAELKITAAQDEAWQAFSAKAKHQAEEMQTLRKSMWAGATGSAPELMAQRSALMQKQIANMEVMSAALKDLYAVLTPEQKAIADQSFGGMHGQRMGHGRRW